MRSFLTWYWNAFIFFSYPSRKPRSERVKQMFTGRSQLAITRKRGSIGSSIHADRGVEVRRPRVANRTLERGGQVIYHQCRKLEVLFSLVLVTLSRPAVPRGWLVGRFRFFETILDRSGTPVALAWEWLLNRDFGQRPFKCWSAKIAELCPMRRSNLLMLTLIGLLSTLYFAWACYRLSDRVLVTDQSWPRPWPYPDRWLSAVEGWLDVRNPPAADNIKLHGEFASLRLLILVPLALSLQALVVIAVMFNRARPKSSNVTTMQINYDHVIC
jgi:hypothetical protein